MPSIGHAIGENIGKKYCVEHLRYKNCLLIIEEYKYGSETILSNGGQGMDAENARRIP